VHPNRDNPKTDSFIGRMRATICELPPRHSLTDQFLMQNLLTEVKKRGLTF
jgi:hypothetical protein